MEEDLITQEIVITTDWVVNIKIKNSSVDSWYCMPVKLFNQIMIEKFIQTNTPVLRENEGGIV